METTIGNAETKAAEVVKAFNEAGAKAKELLKLLENHEGKKFEILLQQFPKMVEQMEANMNLMKVTNNKLLTLIEDYDKIAEEQYQKIKEIEDFDVEAFISKVKENFQAITDRL